MMKTKNVLFENQEFIKSINHRTEDKLQELNLITGQKINDFEAYDSLKKITSLIMNQSKKDDYHFLLWLHYVGYYTKTKYKGEWALIRRPKLVQQGDFLSPIVINQSSDVWLVGDFCYQLYYKWNKMKNISYNTFYKGDIERVAWSPKFKDLNIPNKNLIELEK